MSGILESSLMKKSTLPIITLRNADIAEGLVHDRMAVCIVSFRNEAWMLVGQVLPKRWSNATRSPTSLDRKTFTSLDMISIAQI